MGSSLLAVIVDCEYPHRQAQFWSRALPYEVSERNNDEFQVHDASGAGASLYFKKVPEPKVGKNRLHLDLAAQGPMDAEVARLESMGARLVEVRHDPSTLENPDVWTVMTDPEGNEFCVLSATTVTGWR